jgi:hypothetical protein
VFLDHTQNSESVTAVGGQLSISDNNIFTFASPDQNKHTMAAADIDTEELLENFSDNNFQDCFPDPCWEVDSVNNDDVSMNGLTEVKILICRSHFLCFFSLSHFQPFFFFLFWSRFFFITPPPPHLPMPLHL